MKKLLTLTAVGAILTAPATAVQKCVHLNPYALCYGSADIFSFEWSGWCDDGAGDIAGVAVCADGYSSYGETSTYPYTDEVNTNGIEAAFGCWCKLTHPFVSKKWVFVGAMTSTHKCYQDCAQKCAYTFTDGDGTDWAMMIEAFTEGF